MKEHTDRKAKKNEQELRKLRAQNKQLKRELNELKAELQQQTSGFSKPSDDVAASLQKHARNEQLFSKKRYFSYVCDLIRHTSFFALYSRMIRFVRRYTLIRTTLRILTALLAFLETSAIFVVSASVFIVTLPFTILISYTALLFTFFRGRRLRVQNQAKMEGKKITVFFPPKHYEKRQDSFFCGMVREEAKKSDHFCVIVSPYFLKSTGITEDKKSPYLIARSDGEHILLIRRHYYFSLKKKVFSSLSSNVTEIY